MISFSPFDYCFSLFDIRILLVQDIIVESKQHFLFNNVIEDTVIYLIGNV
jgi:hypothetical protein